MFVTHVQVEDTFMCERDRNNVCGYDRRVQMLSAVYHDIYVLSGSTGGVTRGKRRLVTTAMICNTFDKMNIIY